jgi:hypothetical protein
MKTTDQSEPRVFQEHDGFAAYFQAASRSTGSLPALLPNRRQERLALKRPRTRHGIPGVRIIDPTRFAHPRFDPQLTKRMQRHFQADKSAGA